MKPAKPLPAATVQNLNIDGVLEIVSDGTPNGTVVTVDGKRLAMLQSLAFRVTPEGVMVQLTAVAAKATVVGRIATLERAEVPTGTPDGKH